MNKVKYREYHSRLHPVTFKQLRIHKFHTGISMNDLINILLKEALDNNHIKQKVLSLYHDEVSEHMIRDWRDSF